MGEVIAFPVRPGTHAASPRANPARQHDPYYRFIQNVLSTVNACGFSMPMNLDAAVEHVYQKTHDASELARLLRNPR